LVKNPKNIVVVKDVKPGPIKFDLTFGLPSDLLLSTQTIVLANENGFNKPKIGLVRFDLDLQADC
jgi:hypothetical protein